MIHEESLANAPQSSIRSGALPNTPDTLLRARYLSWEELEIIAARGPRVGSEVDRLDDLLRATASDLVVAEREFPSDRVTAYLRGLVGRVAPTLTKRPRLSVREVRTFLTVELKEAARALRVEIGIAALALLGSLTLAFIGGSLAPDRVEGFLDHGVRARIAHVGRQANLGERSPWVSISPSMRANASSLVAINNIQVCLLAFAGGATLGLLTLHVLLTNGVLLGLVGAAAARQGALISLASFVAAHGILELSVIIVSGAAGLGIARAVLHPAGRNRRDAAVLAARQGITLVLAGAVALLLAGALEGFLSPALSVPPWVKLLLGIVVGGLFWGGLFGVGWRSQPVRG